jgi:hypothetical protein
MKGNERGRDDRLGRVLNGVTDPKVRAWLAAVLRFGERAACRDDRPPGPRPRPARPPANP